MCAAPSHCQKCCHHLHSTHRPPTRMWHANCRKYFAIIYVQTLSPQTKPLKPTTLMLVLVRRTIRAPISRPTRHDGTSRRRRRWTHHPFGQPMTLMSSKRHQLTGSRHSRNGAPTALLLYCLFVCTVDGIGVLKAIS